MVSESKYEDNADNKSHSFIYNQNIVLNSLFSIAIPSITFAKTHDWKTAIIATLATIIFSLCLAYKNTKKDYVNTGNNLKNAIQNLSLNQDELIKLNKTLVFYENEISELRKNKKGLLEDIKFFENNQKEIIKSYEEYKKKSAAYKRAYTSLTHEYTRLANSTDDMKLMIKSDNILKNVERNFYRDLED